MLRWIQQISMTVKLTALVFVVVLTALGLMTGASYQASTSVIRANQERYTRVVLERTDQTLLMFQEQLNTLLLAAGHQEQLWSSSPEEIERTLETYITYNTFIERLYVIRSDDGRLIGAPTPIVRTYGQLVAPVVLAFEQGSAPGVWWTEPYKSAISGWTVTVGMRIWLPDAGSPGIIAADIPLLRFKDVLAHVDLRHPSTLMVVTRNLKPVIADPSVRLLNYHLADNRLDLPAPFAEAVAAADSQVHRRVTVGDEPFLIMAGPANRFGWRSIVLQSDADIQQAYGRIRTVSGWLLAILAALSLGLAWFVAKFFAAPLERLAREMERVREGNLQGVHVPARQDEIGRLAGAFDDMMERIRLLVDDLRMSERRKKEAEIRSLQSQIRPHFLYNVLNAIGASATLGHTENVTTMVRSLIRLLSFTLDKVHDRVTLAEELEHLSHYIKLQQVRYGNIFNVAYDIAPGVSRVEVPKLTLQPLVENAIFHGLSGLAEGGNLRIEAYLEADSLILRVVDNGAGIPPNRLQELEDNVALKGAGHMGLRNVRERLLLHYGTAASLTISSSTGNPHGTAITVRLPVPDGEVSACVS